MQLEKVFSVSLGAGLGQCRAVPISLGRDEQESILVVSGPDFDVDPYVEMFFFPAGTLTMSVVGVDGEVLWTRDLGPGVVPGVWFCPVYPFDLDGDGVDEIWYVSNGDPKHPLGISTYTLQRLDPRTGALTGEWPWPRPPKQQQLSHLFRNFVFGGYAGTEPVLITAQGTYGPMQLQGWSQGVRQRWETHIAASEPGARGSHMCPVVDVNGDGVDEFFWGERCMSVADGSELFCADRDTYRGHSDIILPVHDWDTGTWSFYTCRESDGDAAPRVARYAGDGTRIWGALDRGHIDMGWVAMGPDGGRVAMATRIGEKRCGPDGREHEGVEEFLFDLESGAPSDLPMNAYKTIPVDLNGDGVHEFVRGAPGGNGEVLDSAGEQCGSVGGAVALATRVVESLPGEQVLSYSAAGEIALWFDADASDAPHALRRYAHPYYSAARRLSAVGYNLVNLGGL